MNPLPPNGAQTLQELRLRLIVLDQLLGSVPLQQQQQELDFGTLLSEDFIASISDEVATQGLYKIVKTVPRFDLIPAVLVNVCRYKTRDPTCSEVLALLPRLDKFLELSLYEKINAITSLVPPFRLLDLPTELRLYLYTYILPRQPYLTLLNIEPRRHAIPRFDLAALRTCQQIHDELIDHFYKDQVLVMNVYDLEESSWAFVVTSPRDRLIALNMRRETRSCFKRLEIRMLDIGDPRTDRKGSYWEAMETDVWDSDPYFTETLQAFPNLETATVSFEILENNLRYWGGWFLSLGRSARFMYESVPKHIQLRWDFRPTSDPSLQELAEEKEAIMWNLKEVVAEEEAKRGGTVQLGKSVVNEPIAPATE
ncbi:hypothetical protein OPT61_g6547 [Boeremia exigua]|uniref:Uncharacterized protein n=1 Tax=Boeremia exigua TaxID=749465 RepID=A0ACC2I5K9_9PLEO|nr:hypothetical protein OPT61_g6547 [Boeremia exigua]